MLGTTSLVLANGYISDRSLKTLPRLLSGNNRYTGVHADVEQLVGLQRPNGPAIDMLASNILAVESHCNGAAGRVLLAIRQEPDSANTITPKLPWPKCPDIL